MARLGIGLVVVLALGCSPGAGLRVAPSGTHEPGAFQPTGSLDAGVGPSFDFAAAPELGPEAQAAYEAQLRHQIEERKAQTFARYLEDPFPSPDAEEPATRCWGRAGFILSAYRSGVELARADDYLREIERDLGFEIDGKADASPCYFALPLLVRLHYDREARPHLTEETHAILLRLMHRFAYARSRVATALGSTWRIEMSENHDAIQKAAFLLATRALSQAHAPFGPTYPMADGLSASEHHAAWQGYWMRYFADRAREGIGCEIASPIYAKHTLASYLGVRDFAVDPGLRGRADDFLALYWADVAQDFLPTVGVRSGAESRTYKDAALKLGTRQSTRPAAWLYGWHDEAPTSIHPLSLVMAASDFAPSARIHAQATAKRTPLLYTSRRCGRGEVERIDDEPHYTMRFDGGRGSHLVRTTYLTEAYGLGALSFDPDEPYNALAGQNRAMGVVFGSSPNDRIVFHGIGLDRGGTVGYDEITGAVLPEVLMVARDPKQRRSAGLRVFVSAGTLWSNRSEAGGWWFTRTPTAYFAMRLPDGRVDVVEEKHGYMLEPRDSWTPLIVQMGEPDRDGSFESFKTRVLAQPYLRTPLETTVEKRRLSSDDHERIRSRVQYRSLAGDVIEAFSHNAERPRLNGRAIDLLPDRTYESPYLSSGYRSDRVTLFHPWFGAREIDFSTP